MRFIITGTRSITSKKGQEFTVVNGLTSNGKTVEALLNAEQLASAPALVALSKEQLADLFESSPSVEIEFNSEGRVESISA